MLLAGLLFAWWSQKIRHQEREDQAIKLLAESPNPLGWNYNPVALVRVVNHLQSMGKADAIEALRRFASENPNKGYRSPHQSLELIVPLLFDRMEPEDKFPVGWIDPKDFKLDATQWDNSIDVESDIPFHTANIGGTSGWPPDQTYLIEWADRHGRMRSTPLRPTDDPFDAAERAIYRLDIKHRESHNYLEGLRSHIHRQVYAAVQPLVSTGESEQALESSGTDEGSWKKLKEKCLKLNIHWSAEKQEYEAAYRY